MNLTNIFNIQLMKKIMFMAVAVLLGATANAQNPAVAKQIKSAKDYQTVLGLLNSNLQSLANDEKAVAYNKLVDLALEKFNKEQNVQITNQAMKKDDPYDKVGMNEAAKNALVAAIECDKYDQLPNAKGKVAPKFRKKNAERMTSARNALINAGQDAYNGKDFEGAKEFFGLYVDSKNAPLFEGIEPIINDQFYGQVAYFAALSAYNGHDYVNASKYAGEALGDKESGKDAMDIKILSMKAQLKTKEDSVKYLNDIKALYDKDPADERMFALLVEYYTSVNENDAKKVLIDSQVQNHPSKMAWALKGENDMGEKKWAEAIESYKKSLALDPEFIQVQFNLALCQNNQAISIKDANGGNLTPEAKSLLEESIANLTKIKEKDPNRETINWAYILYQAYYLIGNEEEAKKLESLIQ